MIESGLWDTDGMARLGSTEEVEDPNRQQVEEECPICLETLPKEEGTITDCCEKNFHTACLNRWKLISPRCPTCNLPT